MWRVARFLLVAEICNINWLWMLARPLTNASACISNFPARYEYKRLEGTLLLAVLMKKRTPPLQSRAE